jgi:glycerophosphoryl diester phosphodiesterase
MVGIYPELKKPAFHTQEGYDIGKIVLELLSSYGYQGPDANMYLQCFDPQYLKRIRVEFATTIPLIQLIGNEKLYDHLVTPAGLDDIATYADGIGPSLTRIVQHEEEKPIVIMNLVKEAHDRLLLVHPYTFRKDSFPPYVNSLEELLRMFYFVIGVDGVFTDFPDIAVRLLTAAGY